MTNTTKRVKMLCELWREDCRHVPGDKFTVVDPPEHMKEDYPNSDKSAWVVLDNGHYYRLVRQTGFVQFEFV